MQIRSYEAKDGTRRKAAEVIADDVRFLSPKDGGSYREAPPVESSPFAAGNDADMVGDDDLPF